MLADPRWIDDCTEFFSEHSSNIDTIIPLTTTGNACDFHSLH